MNDNYYWQKHQANERLRDRRREAEAWRLQREVRPRRAFLPMLIWKRLFRRETDVKQPLPAAGRRKMKMPTF